MLPFMYFYLDVFKRWNCNTFHIFFFFFSSALQSLSNFNYDIYTKETSSISLHTQNAPEN